MIKSKRVEAFTGIKMNIISKRTVKLIRYVTP